ncbi:MAG: CBS domain-containing protein [Pirellulaceae bacterium]
MNFHLHLDTETVEQLGYGEFLSVTPEVTLRNVLELLREQRKCSLLIVQDERLAGIFTERDALKLMAAGADLDVPIHEVMNRSPATIGRTETAAEAIRKMANGGYRRLPVLDDDGKPLGVLKVSQILHYLVAHFPRVIYTLPPKPHHTLQHREGA